MSEQWYYTNQGQAVGPIGIDELRQMAGGGRLAVNDLVWSEGMPTWAEAGTVGGLFAPGTGKPSPIPPPIVPPATQSSVSTQMSSLQRARQTNNSSKSKIYWVIGSISVVVLAILVVVIFVVKNKHGGDADAQAQSVSADGDATANSSAQNSAAGTASVPSSTTQSQSGQGVADSATNTSQQNQSAGQAPTAVSAASRLEWNKPAILTGTIGTDVFENCCFEGKETRTSYVLVHLASKVSIIGDSEEEPTLNDVDAVQLGVAVRDVKSMVRNKQHVTVMCEQLWTGNTGSYALPVYCNNPKIVPN